MTDGAGGLDRAGGDVVEDDDDDNRVEELAERQVRRWWEVGKSGNRLVRTAWRTVVFTVGASLVLLGLALAVLPGPFTIPLVIAGLAVLATEFVWARALLERAKEYAAKAKSKVTGKGKRRKGG